MALIITLLDWDYKNSNSTVLTLSDSPVNSPFNSVPAVVPVLSVTFFSEFLLSGYEPHCFPPKKR